jgi:hypothetical protein
LKRFTIKFINAKFPSDLWDTLHLCISLEMDNKMLPTPPPPSYKKKSRRRWW